MRYSGLILALFFTTSVLATDMQRNVVGKLTSSAKPEIRVMSKQERKVASKNMLALNLDVSPDQIVCKKVRVSRDSASKLKVQRCKTRAQFREDAQQQLAALGVEINKSKYLQEYNRQLRSRRGQGRVPIQKK